MNNPLNIDFGAIIQTAERRRMNLEAISAMVGAQANIMVRDIQSCRTTLEHLNAHWDALDAEGKNLLPPDVRTVLSHAERYVTLFENVLGQKDARIPGWRDLAEVYGQPLPSTVKEEFDQSFHMKAGEFLQPDEAAVNSDFGSIEIIFRKSEYDGDQPTWLCSHANFNEVGEGANPIDAYYDWATKNKLTP